MLGLFRLKFPGMSFLAVYKHQFNHGMGPFNNKPFNILLCSDVYVLVLLLKEACFENIYKGAC